MVIKTQRELEVENGYLTGQLLVATPQIQLSPFAKSVVYICSHNALGAMGIIINEPVSNVDTREVLKDFNADLDSSYFDFPLHFGGPVEKNRGFVLHSSDYSDDDTVGVGEGFGLTSNLAILEAISEGEGPVAKLVTLGYAGWEAYQLEAEMEEDNGWFSVPATAQLIFGTPDADKWRCACNSLGVDPFHISNHAGHA